MGKAALVKQISAVVLSLALVGCSGYQRFQPSDSAQWPPASNSADLPFAVGSSIILRTTDGHQYKGTVDLMDETSIVVAGQLVPYAQVELIQVRSFLWVPTVAMAATAAVAGLVFLIPEPSIGIDGQ